MARIDFFTFRFFSKFYLKFMEKRLNSLDSNINDLKQLIEKEKKLVEESRQNIARIIEKNTSIKKDYTSALNLFENEYKTICIKNNNYNLSPWENVYIKKVSSHYIIHTKIGEDIYVFDETMHDFLDYFLTLNHSIIVLSVDKRRVLLQFRLH